MYAICLGSALGLQNTMSRWEAIVMSHINNIEWKYSLQLTFPIDRLWFVLSEFPILQSREPGTEGFSSLPKVTQIVYCRAEINTRAMRILSYSAIPWWYLGRNARIVASPMCHGALQQTRLMRPLSLIFSIYQPASGLSPSPHIRCNWPAIYSNKRCSILLLFGVSIRCGAWEGGALNTGSVSVEFFQGVLFTITSAELRTVAHSRCTVTFCWINKWVDIQ